MRDYASKGKQGNNAGSFGHASKVTWTLGDLQDALLSIASNSTFHINLCVFVDALDEHDGDHGMLLSTLERVARLSANTFFRLRLCLAGR